MPDPLSEPDLTRHLTVGMRVVLRHRIDGGFTDALGELTAVDAAHLSVETRRGLVLVARHDIVAAKEVPPKPVRRGAPHLAISMTDLQELMVAGMPPLRSTSVGGWLLREASGYTGRANSALPLGDPGLPLPQTLSEVGDWYTGRNQAPLLQVYGPDGFEVSCDAVGRAALEAGWTAFQRTLVLTASVDALTDAAPRNSSMTARVAADLDDDWWFGAAEREQEHRGTAAQIFDLVQDGEYVTMTADGNVVAVGRIAFASAWAGVFSVHVLPAHRRQGIAREVMAVSARRAQTRGIRSMYLQVSRDNEAAVALYRSLGFRIHHEYWYLRAPTQGA